MARYIDAELFADRLLNAWDTADKEKKSEIVAILSDIVTPILVGTPTADVAPRAEVIEEYRKKVYTKMEKYTVFGREYIQRIMREVEKEMNGGEQYAKKP